MDAEDLKNLFSGHIVERHERLQAGLRLVHYTTADSAYKILTGRQVWLRNAELMNDVSEIEHGLQCLNSAWDSPGGRALQAMLGRLRSGLAEELTELFNSYDHLFRNGSFIISLSEHLIEEDKLGRLSMWRAYGGKSGVAIVMNVDVFLSESDEMKVFSSPVFYHDVDGFVAWFQGWAGALLGREADLKLIDPELLKGYFFLSFRMFGLCTKHPGFAEEREWRVFHSPGLEEASDWVEPAVETVQGVPQHLIKLFLKDDEARGIVGVAPATLVNRIIVGPCDHPLVVRAALGTAMIEAGIDDAFTNERLWMSLIPLRNH